MAVKGNTVRRDESFFDIKTVNGDELHTLTTRADSEYLVIDLGNISERHTGFDETLKVAMNAAVNAVIASMGIMSPGVRTRKAESAPKVVTSVGDAVNQVDKQGWAERNAQRREALNACILADSEWLSAKELSEKAQFKNTNPSAGSIAGNLPGGYLPYRLTEKTNIRDMLWMKAIVLCPSSNRLSPYLARKKRPGDWPSGSVRQIAGWEVKSQKMY